MDFTLTDDQEQAFVAVKNFFTDEDNPAIVIKGSAGTGKTYLTKQIVDYIIDSKNLAVVAIAPTHKAKRVLSKMLNRNRVIPVPSFTIASILSKIREHSYIGSHKYSKGSTQKMDNYQCFILDEVSMVCDNDLEQIIDYICTHNKKLILIGDACQIPAPSQVLVKSNNSCYKPDSLAFDIENILELNTIVRQVEGSIIIRIANYIRTHLMDDFDLVDILHQCNISLADVSITHTELYTTYTQDLIEGLDTRIIAYTNEAVRMHNKNIRTQLGHVKPVVIGELLTGYPNVGWPEIQIENGTDYKVSKLIPVSSVKISHFSDLVGTLVNLIDIDDSTHVSRNLFIIDIHHKANNKFMLELVRRAELVNTKHSTKETYKKYHALKNRAVFLDDVYKIGNDIMTEMTLRQNHPLLFTKISALLDISTSKIALSDLTLKLEELYGDIIESRLVDNKAIGDTEVLADQFMVVEKDIYYGYAITAHKSQGSTYQSTFVDENDFKKINDKWNHKMRCIETRVKEKNQLKYVAYTRASLKLKIVL